MIDPPGSAANVATGVAADGLAGDCGAPAGKQPSAAQRLGYIPPLPWHDRSHRAHSSLYVLVVQ